MCCSSTSAVCTAHLQPHLCAHAYLLVGLRSLETTRRQSSSHRAPFMKLAASGLSYNGGGSSSGGSSSDGRGGSSDDSSNSRRRCSISSDCGSSDGSSSDGSSIGRSSGDDNEAARLFSLGSGRPHAPRCAVSACLALLSVDAHKGYSECAIKPPSGSTRHQVRGCQPDTSHRIGGREAVLYMCAVPVLVSTPTSASQLCCYLHSFPGIDRGPVVCS